MELRKIERLQFGKVKGEYRAFGGEWQMFYADEAETLMHLVTRLVGMRYSSIEAERSRTGQGLGDPRD